MTTLADPPPTPDLAADLGDRYQLRRPAGRGAGATVWEALDRATGTPVAVKRFAHRPAGDGFYRELRALLRLRHPKVVRVLNLIDAPAARLLVLEFCPGGSLRAAVTPAGWSPARAAEVGRQVLAGLAAAHAAGLTHRDVKPENVLFDRADPGPWGGRAGVKVADFGLAGACRPADALGAADGTPAYMAPEAWTGPGGPAADVYAAGAVLFELLHGRPPFAGGVAELARQHLYAEPAFAPGLPAGWRDLLAAMLAKDPADRPTALEAERRLAGLESPPAGGFARCLGVAATAVVVRPGGEVKASAPGGLYRLGRGRADAVRVVPMPAAQVAHAGPDGAVWLGCGAEVWRLPPGADRAEPALGAAGPVAGLAAGDGRLAVLAGGLLAEYGPELFWEQPTAADWVARAAGGVAAAAGRRLTLFGPDGRVRRAVELSAPCRGLAPWPGGDLLAVLAGGEVWRVSAAGVEWTVPAAGAVRLAAGGGRVVGLRADGRVVGWTPDGVPTQCGRLDLPAGEPVTGFATDGRRLAAAAGDWVAVGEGGP